VTEFQVSSLLSPAFSSLQVTSLKPVPISLSSLDTQVLKCLCNRPKIFLALSNDPSRCMDNAVIVTAADAAVAMAVDMAVVVAMEEDVVDETTSPLLKIITASSPSSLL